MADNRIPSLDGARAISIELVIVAHLDLGRHVPALWRLDTGNLGVRVFFAVSGFVIRRCFSERTNRRRQLDGPLPRENLSNTSRLLHIPCHRIVNRRCSSTTRYHVCPTTNGVLADLATKTPAGRSLWWFQHPPERQRDPIKAGRSSICEGRQIFEECLLI
jgi:hypothetical protein